MIELSPKALRFARLAAEAHSRDADAPFLEQLEARETTRATRALEISDELGRFCLDRIDTFIRRKPVEGDWDDNDLAYMQSIAAHLSRSLSRERTV